LLDNKKSTIFYCENTVKSFNILAISLNVLQNYFDGPNEVIIISVSTFQYKNQFVAFAVNYPLFQEFLKLVYNTSDQ